MAKKTMKGVIARMFTLVSERMRVHEAIQELIDNSIDANAKNINIELNSKESTFLCTDDGCGMNGEQMEEYADKYISHMPISEKSIGKFGAGSKDAIIKIADQNEGSDIAIVSWTSEEEVSRMRFKVDSKKEDEFRSPELNTTPDKNWVKEHGPHGHQVGIKYIKDIDSSDKQWKSNLIKEISNAYPYIIDKYGINITVNGETLQSMDRMHLSLLGDDVEENGVYIKDDHVFVVKTYTLLNRLNQTSRKTIKVVYLYIPNEVAEKNKDEKAYEFCGLYPILNERYLKVPTYGKTGLPFQISYQGGTGRWRACIFVDGNEDILALKSKKSDGIDISFNNIKLSKYRLVNNKDVTFTEAFEYDFKRLNELSVFQTHENIEVVDGKEIRREDRKLSVDIVKRIFNGETGKTLFKEYDNALNKEKKSALKTKDKKATSTVTAPVSITKEDEDKIKKEVNEELEIALAAQEETDTYSKKPAIELFTNKATGFTEFRYTEYKPQFTDENLVDKIYKILVEEGLKKPQIISICTKVAHLND